MTHLPVMSGKYARNTCLIPDMQYFHAASVSALTGFVMYRLMRLCWMLLRKERNSGS
jgi:hypothetical protein